MSVLELLVGIAIVAVMAGVAFVALPRQGMTVNQAQRIFASGVQFARLEAIKRNVPVEAVFAVDSAVLIVRVSGTGTELRRFAFDSQSAAVIVKEVSPRSDIEFNARGVSTIPIERSVTIGLAGRDDFDRVLSVSGQGAVRSGM